MRREREPIVRKYARLSVRQALGLALALTAASTVLGSAGIFGYQLRQAGRQAERLRLLAMAEVYAAQVAGIIGRPDGNEAPGADHADGASGHPGGHGPPVSDLQTLVQRCIWHPDSRLLAVLDLDGDAAVVRGDRSILEQWSGSAGKSVLLKLADQEREHSKRSSSPPPHVSIVPGHRELCLPDVAVAAVPITPSGSSRPLGLLVYAARTSRPGAGGADGGFWKYVGAALAISAAGILMGLGLLRHSLLIPLHALVRSARDGNRPCPRSGDGSDELDALALLLRDMNCGLDDWRQRVARLEASVDRRVQDETRKVTLQLRQVERKAWMDPLTRLGNRRLMDEQFPQVFREYRESGGDLSIVMIDVDHFKVLNDTLGHKAGDELIGFTGELLRQCVRGEDLAIRYGGDEFLLVLPGVTSAQAGTVAERIIRLFGQRARLFAVEPRPSMSAGVASLRDYRPATAAILLQMADQALYRAKNLGKSQVSVYRPGAARTAVCVGLR